MPKNIKKQRENEGILMTMDLTPALKLASYDYVMAKPDSEALTIFECTEVLEEICQAATGKEAYKYTQSKKHKVDKKQSDFKVDFK
jgi:hypothetical protein